MSKSLLDDWNDPHNRKMRKLYAEQDRTMQAQDGNRDAADLADLRAENAKLREALEYVKQYAQAMLEARVDSPEYVNWRGVKDIARAALAQKDKQTCSKCGKTLAEHPAKHCRKFEKPLITPADWFNGDDA